MKIMTVIPCLGKATHSGFVLSGDRGLVKFHRDLTSIASDIILPEGDISAIAALSPRKLIAVCGVDIYLCTKRKPEKIYEGATNKPMIGTYGKTLYATLNSSRELHRYDAKKKAFISLCVKFDAENEKVFSIGNGDCDKQNVLVVVYRPIEAISRVLEIDRRTGEKKDLNCPSDVMALYRAGDSIFATGSVSSRNTKQFFEFDCKQNRWLQRAERTHGVSNQTTDKVLFVGDRYFVSFAEKAASSGNELIEIYDIQTETWSSEESDFARIRAVACC